MYSVKQRISTITQPQGGFIPAKLFEEKQLNDDQLYVSLPDGTQQLVGLCVDYLTRFCSGESSDEAFKIPLLGAQLVGDQENAEKLVASLTYPLDSKSIANAYLLCGYDVAVRRSPALFKPIDQIKIDQNLIENIRILVQRATSFLSDQGGITDSGVTFEGGYNEIISSGDCDFLTPDTLWDLKVTQDKKVKSQYSLQLAIYYLLGIRSIHHDRFKKIKKLGILNPLTLRAFVINLGEVTDETLLNIAFNVIGYTVKDNQLTGTDKRVLFDAKKANTFYITDFNPNSYKDGIHEITIDDYCTYYKSLDPLWRKPKFKYTKKVKFLKHNGFYMFISVSHKNVCACLDGGHIYNLDKPIQYYYDNLPAYCEQVLKLFSPYWNALFSLANKLKTIPLDDNVEQKLFLKEKKKNPELQETFDDYMRFRNEFGRFLGKVHGFIVDLGFFNHLYINPLDGSVNAYNADNMSSRNVYKSPTALIRKEYPSLYPGYKQLLKDGELPLLEKSSQDYISTKDYNNVFDSSDEDEETTQMTGTDIYSASVKLYKMQRIYEHHLVIKWFQDIMDSINQIE